MTDRDLTPEEARAEVKAFMGEEWEPFVYGPCPVDSQSLARAWRGSTSVAGCGPTYRAAVEALKTAWRDAVRPWVEASTCAAMDSLYLDTLTTEPAKATDAHVAPIIARVLKEDSK